MEWQKFVLSYLIRTAAAKRSLDRLPAFQSQRQAIKEWKLIFLLQRDHPSVANRNLCEAHFLLAEGSAGSYTVAHPEIEKLRIKSRAENGSACLWLIRGKNNRK